VIDYERDAAANGFDPAVFLRTIQFYQQRLGHDSTRAYYAARQSMRQEQARRHAERRARQWAAVRVAVLVGMALGVVALVNWR
jgi:hypothetical protein